MNRLAAPIDITAAGTSAPMAIAAKAKPANQPGNSALNSAGTTSLLLVTFMPGRVAHVAQQRDQPEQQRVGRQQHRVLADRVAAREAKMPVSVCGYMKAASAEPSASVA